MISADRAIPDASRYEFFLEYLEVRHCSLRHEQSKVMILSPLYPAMLLQLQVLPAYLDPAGPLFILYSLYTNRTSSFQASIIDVLKILHVGTVGLGHQQALVLVQGQGVALQTVNTMAAVERVLATPVTRAVYQYIYIYICTYGDYMHRKS